MRLHFVLSLITTTAPDNRLRWSKIFIKVFDIANICTLLH